jgi:polysaccharide biosynthesis/export protein
MHHGLAVARSHWQGQALKKCVHLTARIIATNGDNYPSDGSLKVSAMNAGATSLGRILLCAVTFSLTSCSSFGSGGPSSASIKRANGVIVANAPIKIIDVTDLLARRVAIAHEAPLFSQLLGDASPTETIIGRGDLLQVTIWEAPPAVLFGGSATFGSAGASGSPAAVVAEHSDIPEMMVDERGDIRLPFAGSVHAEGRSPQELERTISTRLARMAHDPQVAVRIAQNASATVAVVGSVGTSGRIAITARGERLLAAIESAGGVTQPVSKVTVQVSRNGRVAALPLEAVIHNPKENIRLGPGDVVNVLYQPFSFTALGATGTSAEIPFESTGITLAQALGRVGGLKDDRANASGAFIFRFEDPAALDPAIAAGSPKTPDGRIPVIYRVDLRNPVSLFAAQHFPMSDKDILYVSTAPGSDLQRFVSILSSMAFTIIGLGQAIPSVHP